MAFYDKPLISFSLPSVNLDDGLPVIRRVHVAVAECSPRDYILVVKSISSLSGLPQDRPAYSSVINDDLRFTFNEETCRVDIHADRQSEYPFQNPFSLYFPNKTKFWSFVAVISRARVALAIHEENWKSLREDVIDSIIGIDLVV